jgi:Peptidase propeptide and YPEB domain
MTQRYMYIISAGIVAFVLVILTALGAYLLLGGLARNTAFASQGNGFGSTENASPQQTAPGGQGLADPQGSGGSSSQAGYAISANDAANIALSSVPGSTLVQQPRLVNFNGTVAYEIQLDAGYVYIDAQSGQVIYNSVNGTQGQPRRRFRR